MAIKEAKTNTDLDALFTQLAEPFDPNQIKWRVTHTTQDGSRGAVVAYADPRAYTDRLNQLFTPTGWTRTYEVSTVSAVTRMKKDKLIQTGKVLVTCTLTITGLSCHAGSGRCRKRVRLLRAIPHQDRTPRQSNGGPSIRESRARSKAFGAFSAIQS